VTPLRSVLADQADHEAPGVPGAGSWVRLVRRQGVHLVPQGRWHRVHGWHASQGRLILGCTERDREISWALGLRAHYAVLRTETEPREAGEVCARCVLRGDPAWVWGTVPQVPPPAPPSF
jgi:hypothetical protein